MSRGRSRAPAGRGRARAQQRELGVSRSERPVRRGMGLLPVQLGSGQAARDQGVDRVEDLFHLVRGRNDHPRGHRHAARRSRRGSGRLEAPTARTPPGDVRSDSDDGPRHFPIVAQPGNGAVNTPCGPGGWAPLPAGRATRAGPPGRKWEEGQRPLLTRFGYARPMLRAAVTAALALALTAPAPAAPTTTFAAAGAEAVQTLLSVYYNGSGLWNECDRPGCNATASDWGADSLTYALALRSGTTGDASIPPVLSALDASAPTYESPCALPDCGSWSDYPLWDSIAASRVYGVTHDPSALAKARAAFSFVESANAFALGACPDIRYQQPAGRTTICRRSRPTRTGSRRRSSSIGRPARPRTSPRPRPATPQSAAGSSTLPWPCTPSTSSTTAPRARRCRTGSSPPSTAT